MPQSPEGCASGGTIPDADVVSEQRESRAPALHTLDPSSILIVKPSSLGDIVHTLPAVAFIKRRWPNARLEWVINPEWAPLLEGNPHVDEVVLFPRREFRGGRGILKILPWAQNLREQIHADLVLDFQCLLRSALVSTLCRSRGGRIVGLSDAREGSRHFYDDIVDVSGRTHAVDRYFALVQALGIQTDEPLDWTLPVGVPVEGVEAGYVLLHPFSRGAGKSMTVDEVVEFCRVLAPHKVLIAGRTDEQLPVIPNARNFLNQTSIAEVIWLIRQAKFVVSVDSGPMHIAAAITPRLLSIHTWSDPLKVGPYRPEAWVWKNERIMSVAEYGSAENGAEARGISDIAEWVRGIA